MGYEAIIQKRKNLIESPFSNIWMSTTREKGAKLEVSHNFEYHVNAITTQTP